MAIFCSQCGKQINEEVKFCKFCGRRRTTEVDGVDKKIEGVAPIDVQASVHNHIGQGVKLGQIRKRWWIAVLVLVVGLVFIVGIVVSKKNSMISQTTTSLSNNLKAVVDIWCDNGQGGSGTIFTPDGTVLTNNHVIASSTSCKVTIPDPETGQIAEIYDAAPVITPILSQEYDVATLKIDGSYTDTSGTTWGVYPTTFPVFTIPSTCNTSTQSQLNDSVRIYGYPVTSGGYNLTVTDGIISSFADDGDILTSAKVDSGNSGGLAVDQNGCWLGIPSAVVSGNYQNLGVIIPGSIVAKSFLGGTPAKFEPIAVSFDTQNLPSSASVEPEETNDQKCQDQYGAYSEWSGKTDSNGPTCECQTGYAWDATGNACASQASLDESCQNSFGLGGYSYTKNLKAVCGCGIGYQWNSDQTVCTIQLTPDQICQRDVGSGSYYLGYKNSNGTYACSTPY